MLTFLAPSGLLALLGVALPVAIHLWNRRPGRTVQVGSIRWLDAANRRLRNLRLEQIALLLLRILVVAVLALALANPIWRQPPPPRRGQVFISPDLLTSASVAAVRPTIDSLRRRGFVLRQLGPRFARVSDTVWQRLATQPAAAAAAASYSFWPRVQQAADSFPGQPLYVYTSATLRHFQGRRPALPAAVRWQTVPLPTPETTWLRGAHLAAPDSLRLLISRSTEDAVLTRAVTVARPTQSATELPRVPGLPPLRYSSVAGRSFIQVEGPDSSRVPILTEPLRVWLYHDADHTLDARYVAAALRAAALGLGPRLELTVSTRPPQAGAPLHWLFWLADAPVPAAWQQHVARGLQLWQDARPAGVAQSTSFTVAPYTASYAITRLDTVADQSKTDILWQAANGRPVLSRRVAGPGAAYRLHTRLHPAWSRLADSPDLPFLLLDLLQPARPAAPDPHDQRQLAPCQITGRATVAPTSFGNRRSAPTDTDLRIWLVVAAAVLWGLERVVATRTFAAKVQSA
ncbi:BatA domain-containing protein [Hymenobacter chitinivorans]|uniref:Putative membrane protein (TIGR02226 family) n=1 Tax=Hymenobacter chitinivorans DSM 11115 TaxID=1121954 RepID=A0A2M9AS97_9BACT|nr:BatA domain-containing protein [Hymenobacter chitinivorans]PJJ48569.1 putative membrane protein (TIGR02226 family) [Hymenobacter chitinivorans DSM 11115]